MQTRSESIDTLYPSQPPRKSQTLAKKNLYKKRLPSHFPFENTTQAAGAACYIVGAFLNPLAYRTCNASTKCEWRIPGGLIR
jgi:hypothetical protein